jgi:hypothetical protein
MESGSIRKWSTEETSRLIEMYREYSLLWDPSCVDYKNRFKKVDALKETGKLLNITPDETDRKLRHINSQYLYETTSICSEILWHANFATSVLAMLSALYNI